jgi:hypothetical protein
MPALTGHGSLRGLRLRQIHPRLEAGDLFAFLLKAVLRTPPDDNADITITL